jgi:hypothetical protein
MRRLLVLGALFFLCCVSFAGTKYHGKGAVRFVRAVSSAVANPYVFRLKFDESYKSTNFVDSGQYALTPFATNDGPGYIYTETALYAQGSGCLTNSIANPSVYGAVVLNDDSRLEIGTNDWTIEFWLYPTNYTATIEAGVITKMTPSSSFAPIWITMSPGSYGGNAYKLALNMDSTGVAPWDYAWFVTPSAVPTNKWTHFAFVRRGAGVLTFTNGVYCLSNSVSASYSWLNNSYHWTVGNGHYTGDSNRRTFPGFIDDIKLTLSAVYTNNFTP